MKNEKMSIEKLISNISNSKYYYVIDEQIKSDENNGWSNGWSIGFDDFCRDELYDGDLVDCFYDVIFDNELKGNYGIVGNDFYEWQDYDRENNGDENGCGKNEILVAQKIVKIIYEYNLIYLKNKIDKLKDLMDLKYVNMNNENLIEHRYMIERVLYNKY
jgi:hypothetical protein